MSENANAKEIKMKKSTVILIVVLTSVLAVAACGIAFITFFSRGSGAASNAPSDAVVGTGLCKVGLLTFDYPAGWKVKDVTDGEYIYPDFGGLVYASRNQSGEKISEETQKACLDSYLEGLERDGSYSCDRSSLRPVDIDGTYAYRCDLEANIDNGQYQGYVELIMVDSEIYAVFAVAPKNMYDSKKSEIDKVLNSVKVYVAPENQASSSPSINADDYKLFEFNDGEWERNSAYTVYTGSITNISNTTYRFVKVKGTFMDESGNSVNTDSAFACGDEGLAPGETTTFRLSTDASNPVSTINLQIYDYII